MRVGREYKGRTEVERYIEVYRSISRYRRIEAESLGALEVWYRIQDTGHRVQDTGYRIQDTGYMIQDTGHRTQDTGY